MNSIQERARSNTSSALMVYRCVRPLKASKLQASSWKQVKKTNNNDNDNGDNDTNDCVADAACMLSVRVQIFFPP